MNISQKYKDRNDISHIHCALIAGTKYETIKELYQHGRTDEAFDVLYKEAEGMRRRTKINWAKRDFHDGIVKLLNAGVTPKDIEALFKREMNKIDSSGA